MPLFSRVLLVTVVLLCAPVLLYADAFSKIEDRIKNLRSLSDTQRPKATMQLAAEIRILPAGQRKIELADHLAGLVTEGDEGQETVQAVADTLRQSLAETPIRGAKDQIPPQYTTLAELVLYAGAKEHLNDRLYLKARQILVNNDAEAAKADFTLNDLRGNKWTLSALRGKIVLVNFWATWCAPCKIEMPELDWLSTRYESQGLVVLSITPEDEAKVRQFASSQNYHLAVLIDQGGKVCKQFHIDEIPKTFVYDREGRLMAVTIDQHTRGQFLRILSDTNLRP
jgi:peroxiredoxin